MSAAQFLETTVRDYKLHLERNFASDIAKENLINTRELLGSVYGQYSASGTQANLSFEFPFHGIYHDMKKRNQRTAEDYYHNRRTKPAKASRPWYNKNLWGTISYFIGELISGYIETSPEAVKKHFPQ